MSGTDAPSPRLGPISIPVSDFNAGGRTKAELIAFAEQMAAMAGHKLQPWQRDILRMHLAPPERVASYEKRTDRKRQKAARRANRKARK